MTTVKEVLEFGKKFYESEDAAFYIMHNAIYNISPDDHLDAVITPFNEDADTFLNEFFVEYEKFESLDDDDWWMNDQRWWGDSVYHGE